VSVRRVSVSVLRGRVLLTKIHFCGPPSTHRPDMARSYRGIDLFDAFESGDFIVWKRMTLAHLTMHMPETPDLLMEPLGEAAMIEALPHGEMAAANLVRARA
jgi:hypothetical protein